MNAEKVLHSGGCHCGKVRWQAEAPKCVTACSCNCSDCSMRGKICFSVPSSCFKLLGESEKFITTYTFGTHTAKHIFCKVCGITSFYRPRTNPERVSLIVSCVDPGTLVHVETKYFDGRNWERSYRKLYCPSSEPKIQRISSK